MAERWCELSKSVRISACLAVCLPLEREHLSVKVAVILSMGIMARGCWEKPGGIPGSQAGGSQPYRGPLSTEGNFGRRIPRREKQATGGWQLRGSHRQTQKISLSETSPPYPGLASSSQTKPARILTPPSPGEGRLPCLLEDPPPPPQSQPSTYLYRA